MLLYRNMPRAIKNVYPERSRGGFTLIELLVVVAILGLLATVGLGSFQSSLMKGRDSQRKHDLGQIQKALEMYLNDHGKYPTTAEGIPNLATGGEWEDANDTLYMKSVPQGPKGDNYCYDSDGIYYQLYAKLENVNDPKKIVPTSAVCTAANGYNYGVSSSNMTP